MVIGGGGGDGGGIMVVVSFVGLSESPRFWHLHAGSHNFSK